MTTLAKLAPALHTNFKNRHTIGPEARLLS
jgi:hypothetical protein